MQLKDLITKPVSELTEAELEERLNALKRLRIIVDKPTKSFKTRSNKDKQVEDLLTKLSPEALKKLFELTKEG